MRNYKNLIGDGKMPNKYFVFQYDQKFKRVKKEDGSIELVLIKEDTDNKNSYLGTFKTYKEALNCVDNMAYLPNVLIEDRLSGQIFEQMCVVCQECNKEEYFTDQMIKYTKEKIEEAGFVFA